MRFKTKPFEIEAVRWTGKNFGEVLEFVGRTGLFFEWVEWAGEANDNPNITAVIYDKLQSTFIPVNTGDYIIRGMKNEFYPCDPEVFEAKYEEVTNG